MAFGNGSESFGVSLLQRIVFGNVKGLIEGEFHLGVFSFTNVFSHLHFGVKTVC